MKRTGIVMVCAMLLAVFAAPLTVHAAKRIKSEVVMKIGSKVNLFHSGNVAAPKDIAVGEVIPVYRTSGKAPQMKKVGEVRVLGFISEHYFQAEIVSGDVKVGDIAKKEKSGLLVQPSE